MKRSLTLLAILPMILSACGLTRIVTVSPDYGSRTTYSTVVTVPKTHTTTTTTRVYAADNDISLYLDLQAVGAAFAQSNTIQEFESLLNNASYMLLQMEHFALLGGTLVLFVCLVVVMYLTKDTGALVRPSSKEASDTE